MYPEVDKLATKLRRRMVVGSYACAMETLQVLRGLISASRTTSLSQLIAAIKQAGATLQKSQPFELAVGNVTRRVLHLIREDYKTIVNETLLKDSKGFNSIAKSSMYNLLGQDKKENESSFFSKHSTVGMKALFIQAITELIDEMESIHHNIAMQSVDHIHNGEIIMTIGYDSKTLEEFLINARRKRKFQVIVAENAPGYQGHKLALTLSNAGIETTLISDGAVYALMSRVNKVMISCHTVLANGGLIATSGTRQMAEAAKYHHIPVVVFTGLYKLSPIQPYDQDMFSIPFPPGAVLNFGNELTDAVEVLYPHFDYIAPDLISLFVTNLGGHPPSYIYRLLTESYDPEDYRLEVTPTPSTESISSIPEH
jgi:translation initiation factor eIF-2B subunit beta